jgi:hypothetical protein
MNPTIMLRSTQGLHSLAVQPSVAELPASGSRRGSRDLAGFTPPPGPARRLHIGVRLLDLAASMGLSLLITAGFAAALGLYTHWAWSSPNGIYACEGIFLWYWAFLSCTSGARS